MYLEDRSQRYRMAISSSCLAHSQRPSYPQQKVQLGSAPLILCTLKTNLSKHSPATIAANATFYVIRTISDPPFRSRNVIYSHKGINGATLHISNFYSQLPQINDALDHILNRWRHFEKYSIIKFSYIHASW